MADKKKDSPLDSFAKALGRKLGQRRKEVHRSIARFQEEANKPAETPNPAPDAEASQPTPDGGGDTDQKES